MFSGAPAHYGGGAGAPGPGAAAEPGADGFVRSVCRALRLAGYSGFFDFAGDGSGAAGAASGFAQGFVQRMSAVETTLHGHVWPVLATIVTLVIAANGGRAGSSLLMDAHFDPRRMPVEAVNYLEKNQIPGPVLSPDNWGGYLIYRLYPRIRVVVDDRHDLYGAQFFRSYLKMMQVERGGKNSSRRMRRRACCCREARLWRTFLL
jgi:hypothetical protein